MKKLNLGETEDRPSFQVSLGILSLWVFSEFNRRDATDSTLEIRDLRLEREAKPCHSCTTKLLKSWKSTFGNRVGRGATGARGRPRTRAPFFRRHLTMDWEDELVYREAFTTTAADQVVDHLVNNRNVHPDR